MKLVDPVILSLHHATLVLAVFTKQNNVYDMNVYSYKKDQLLYVSVYTVLTLKYE